MMYTDLIFSSNNKDLENAMITKEPFLNGLSRVFRFDNGYGATCVKHMGSYGSSSDLWELAVIKFAEDDWDLCYDTEITKDSPDGVLGWLTNDGVMENLRKIQRLKSSDEDEEFNNTKVEIVSKFVRGSETEKMFTVMALLNKLEKYVGLAGDIFNNAIKGETLFLRFVEQMTDLAQQHINEPIALEIAMNIKALMTVYQKVADEKNELHQQLINPDQK